MACGVCDNGVCAGGGDEGGKWRGKEGEGVG